MRILILAARFPEYGHKGDQLRTRQLIELLAAEHDLHVLTAGRPATPEALGEVQGLARVTLVRATPLARALSALGTLARGLPAEVGWMAPHRLRVLAVANAAASDVVIASTVRVVTAPLPVPLIVDHIDALSVNMRERAGIDHRRAVRLVAQLEARLLARHEIQAAGWSAAQITVSDGDARALPQDPLPVVIPHTVAPSNGPPTGARDIDLIFTGNMGYPPNRDAAHWLAEEIAPELRRLRPRTRIVIAGRRANRLAIHGVEIAADVPDLSALLRRARVAIVPLRSGTGVANKLLEAAAADTAIVATERAARSAAIAALKADDAVGLAGAAATLLADDRLRESLVARARADLAGRTPAAVRSRLAEVLAQVVADTGSNAS